MSDMTEIDVPDWVVEVAMAAGETFASENAVSMYATVRDLRREEMRTSIAAALGAWVVPTACADPWLIDYLNSYPKNSVEVSSMDTLSAGDVILFTLRQEKPDVLP